MYDLIFTSCPYIEGHIDLFIRRKTFQHNINMFETKIYGNLKKIRLNIEKMYTDTCKYMYKECTI